MSEQGRCHDQPAEAGNDTFGRPSPGIGGVGARGRDGERDMERGHVVVIEVDEIDKSEEPGKRARCLYCCESVAGRKKKEEASRNQRLNQQGTSETEVGTALTDDG